MPKRLTALLLLVPATARATGVLAEWVASAKDYLAAEIKTPELRATRTCTSVILDWIPLADPNLLYTLERRPDLALNWKWTALSIEDVSSTMIMYNDTAIDNSREYTYRLRVGPNAGNTKREFTYAIASPSTSCMKWSEVATSMIYSLRIRMDSVVATVARITFLLLGIHLVLLGLRNYLGLKPPRGHLQREKIKNIANQDSTSSNELRRRAAFSSASCSSTETESDMDAPRLSISHAASVASSAQISTASTRNLDVKDQRCHGCRKKFGLFRKRRVCSVCNMGLCRPCGIARTSAASKRYICLPCRAHESMPPQPIRVLNSIANEPITAQQMALGTLLNKSFAQRVTLGQTMRFLDKYFIINTLLIGSYVGARYYGYTSESVLEREDYLGMTREQQMFVFLVGFTIINYPNKSTLDAVISMIFLYGKGGIGCLFYMLDTTLFVYYVVACLVAFVLFPYPKYQGPHDIVDLNPESFERRLKADKKVKWIVYFYADWCEDCLHQDAMYANLSLKYSSDAVKFGRVDVEQHPSLAKQYQIDIVATTTVQLPTMILFENGKETKRVPRLDENGKAVKTLLNTHGIELLFGLGQQKEE